MDLATVLEDTQRSLEGVIASLQHVPDETVRNGRIATRAALGKAGFLGSTALGMQTAAAIGTASTGTAISSLSGAALYSSQMAWLGFGSMAVGGVVLLGIGAATAKTFNSTYTRFYSGKPRKPETMSKEELNLLVAAQELASTVDAIIVDGEKINRLGQLVLALDGIYPITQQLQNLFKKGEGRSKKLAIKPGYKLERHYWELMTACEKLAVTICEPNMARLNGIEKHVSGIAMPILEDAFNTDEAGKKTASKLRRIYLNLLEKKARLNFIETGELHLNNAVSDIGHGIKKAFTGTKDAIQDYGPVATKVAGDLIADMWKRTGNQDVTNREKLAEGTKTFIAVAKEGGRTIKKGFSSSKNQGVRAIEKLKKKVKTMKDGRFKPKDAKQPKRRSWSSMVVMAVTFQKLLSDEYANLTLEEDMVLQAMRIAIPHLADSKATEIADYLQELSPEQLRGVMSTTKGKYHELLYVEAQNLAGANVKMHEDINHAGSDVIFVTDDGIVTEVQLKAVATPDHVRKHLEHYPGIEIHSTEEVAALTGVQSSGFSNADISEEVRLRMKELEGESLFDDMLDAAATSVLLHGVIASKRALSGRYSRDQMVGTLNDTSIAIGTGILLEQLLSS